MEINFVYKLVLKNDKIIEEPINEVKLVEEYYNKKIKREKLFKKLFKDGEIILYKFWGLSKYYLVDSKTLTFLQLPLNLMDKIENKIIVEKYLKKQF
jgi:hypothetical protein